MKRHPITDHALIRYCERVKGIDMDWVRDHILTDGLEAAIKAGAIRYQADGWHYKIRNGRVMTITKGR